MKLSPGEQAVWAATFQGAYRESILSDAMAKMSSDTKDLRRRARRAAAQAACDMVRELRQIPADMAPMNRSEQPDDWYAMVMLMLGQGS